MREINLHNQCNLGDHVFNFILFYNIKDYIEKNNILINFYCKEKYYSQVLEFNFSDNINIINSNDRNGIDTWIGNRFFKINYYTQVQDENLKKNNKTLYDVFYLLFFNEVLNKLNIPIIIDKFEYEDPNLLIRNENINEKFSNKYLDIDILILNSTAMSGQYKKDDNEWNNLIYKLNNKYKIFTTEKVEGINCTIDDNLTIKDIAAISINTKKIIAVNSGVVPGLFNKYTLNNVEVIYIFDNLHCYQNEKFKDVCNINELNFLFEDSN